MDIRAQLLSELSRANVDFTIHSLGNSKEHFRELIEIILNDKDPLPMRASWVAEGITARYPALIDPYMKELVSKFSHPGTMRNILKIFSRIDINKKFHGEIAHTCFDWITDEDKPVAVKVYSMQILANLIRIYPELENEFMELIDEQIPRSSAGFKACAKKIKIQLSGD